MMSYAEYPHAMPLHDNDFPLFPQYSDYTATSQAYIPTNTYQEPGFPASAYGSYAAHHTFPGQQLHNFSFNVHNVAQGQKAAFNPHSPLYSPTNSASNSFDFQPPVLSSTSDSGASVQSALSSAMGSPSLNAQNSADWPSSTGLGISLNIVNPDSFARDPFATTSFEVESLLAQDKDLGCVGESGELSSCQSPQEVDRSSQSSSQCPSLVHHDSVESCVPGHWPSCPSAAFSMESAEPSAPSSSGVEQKGFPSTTKADRTSREGSVFRSPTTPALAALFQPWSPTLARVKGQRKPSVPHVQKPRTKLTGSPLNQSLEVPEPQSEQARTPADEKDTDPALIQPYSPPPFPNTVYPEVPTMQTPQAPVFAQSPSPAPSHGSIRSHPPPSRTMKAPGSVSPYLHTQTWQPYPQYPRSRQQSVSSIRSRVSRGSQSSLGSSDDANKGLCPISTCGRHFKDLKAHMLTHQNERPEKCPILTCDYHTKGFARKYDKNRHTLTHYKGTMVCGFCPGSGSAAEKSFNRADVFKRHLTSVHGVEQTPPNARRKSPTAGKKGYNAQDVAGTCSTCSVTFANAQEFYEHLDDCVLRIVQQADPSEAINQKLLTSVSEDDNVRETMDRHMLSNTVDYTLSEEDEAVVEELDKDDANDTTYGTRSSRTGKGAIKTRKSAAGSNPNPQPAHARNTLSHLGGGSSNPSRIGKAGHRGAGLTYSKGGVPYSGGSATATAAAIGKGAKRRKNYPLSWGAAPETMKMKKRVLCVYDGQRRLWKDDMMLDAENEVRVPLAGGDGKSWVTDLDVLTLRRAEGLHGTTEEERGPWGGGGEVDLEGLMG
ncbi:hypothetical protein LTR50_007827 [Elasticomyces elasticus]|nr:hypothetical protein LTR50_007827 [Elasticomyces elasticus]